VLRSASAKWGMNRLAFVAASIAALKVKKNAALKSGN